MKKVEKNRIKRNAALTYGNIRILLQICNFDEKADIKLCFLYVNLI